LEHIIRAASQVANDSEIVVIGSQAIHAQVIALPSIAFRSAEADVYPRNHPERAEEIDAALGELSPFHATYGYYAHGVSPKTAILPDGWESRLIRLSNPNTGGATGLCLDIDDLALSKYATGRVHDRDFNQALVQAGCLAKRKLVRRIHSMPLDEATRLIIRARIEADFAAAHPPSTRKRSPP
jgi:hypothetical protein